MGASTVPRDEAKADPQQRPAPAARRVDPAAFRAMYEAHAVVVTRRLTHATGDPNLARDLAQDTFVVAFDRLQTFRGDSSLSTWLHAIAFNLLRDHRKRARREQSLWSRLRRRPAPTVVEPERTLQSREELERLQAIVSGLDAAKRDAFVLRVIEQLSLAEAAAILGVRVATVSYRTRRAEALVREAFEKEASS